MEMILQHFLTYIVNFKNLNKLINYNKIKYKNSMKMK